MFGSNTVKVKIDKDLMDRLRKVADVAGYATTEEFVAHVLEFLVRFGAPDYEPEPPRENFLP